MPRTAAPTLIPAAAGYFLAVLTTDGEIIQWPVVAWRWPSDDDLKLEHVVTFGKHNLPDEVHPVVRAPAGCVLDLRSGAMHDTEAAWLATHGVTLAAQQPEPAGKPLLSGLPPAERPAAVPQIRSNPEDRQEPSNLEKLGEAINGEQRLNPRDELLSGPGYAGEGTVLPGQDNPTVAPSSAIDLGDLASDPERAALLDDESASLI